jgi:hypothetical protein
MSHVPQDTASPSTGEATILQFPARLECSKCGASATASCDCGVAYVPAGMRAAEAVTANPEKSNRAIAAEIDVDEKTVRKARKSTADQSAVGKRVGKDGKSRKLPEVKPVTAKPEPDVETSSEPGADEGAPRRGYAKLCTSWKAASDAGRAAFVEACRISIEAHMAAPEPQSEPARHDAWGNAVRQADAAIVFLTDDFKARGFPKATHCGMAEREIAEDIRNATKEILAKALVLVEMVDPKSE